MRFPSLQSLGSEAWRCFLRFPVAIVLVAKAVVLGIRLVHVSNAFRSEMEPGWYWDAIVSCYLGMLLSIAMTVWLEKRRAGRGMRIGIQAAVLALTALYYWSLPPQMGETEVLRTVVLALGLHWLIAVIGFRSKEVNGFWQFNKQLFMRVLATGLYTAVLYIGIALALGAVDKLFNIDVKDKVYMDFLWLIGGLFSVWFFLAGMPRSYDSPAQIADYPKGLKVFTQYVLLTLVTIYMLILYAYIFKIIITKHWPAGWVAWMITAFAVAGILSLLLIYPLRNDPDSAWVRGYWKFFYSAQLPLNVMLLIAVEKRIIPYGYTEQRYLLMVLTIWLFGITVYFLYSKRKDIRLVPMSLCVAAFLCCWGPWGAFSVSVRSQLGRLTGLLDKHAMLAGGKMVSAKDGNTMSFDDRLGMSSVVDYFVEQHGYDALQPIFGQSLDSLMRRNNLTGRWDKGGQAEAIMELMNVRYATKYSRYLGEALDGPEAPRQFRCEAVSDDSATVTGGAMYMGKFAIGPSDSDWDFVTVGHDKLRLTVDSARGQIRLAWVSGGADLVVDLSEISAQISASTRTRFVVSLPGRELELPFAGPAISGKMVLSSLEGTRNGKRVNFSAVRGTILFSKK